jgi:hypothetical protein
VQALAALLWIGYGIFIKAAPVVAANVAVALSAIYSSRRQSASDHRRGVNRPASPDCCRVAAAMVEIDQREFDSIVTGKAIVIRPWVDGL